jgi:hypothetical protein
MPAAERTRSSRRGSPAGVPERRRALGAGECLPLKGGARCGAESRRPFEAAAIVHTRRWSRVGAGPSEMRDVVRQRLDVAAQIRQDEVTSDAAEPVADLDELRTLVVISRLLNLGVQRRYEPA